MRIDTKYNHGDNVQHIISGQKGIITSLTVSAKNDIKYEISSGIGSSDWVDECEIKIDNSTTIKLG